MPGEYKGQISGAGTDIEHLISFAYARPGHGLRAPEVVKPETETAVEKIDRGRYGGENVPYVEFSLS
jgi:hypothetical protein